MWGAGLPTPSLINHPSPPAYKWTQAIQTHVVQQSTLWEKAHFGIEADDITFNFLLFKL